jgi:hypothetical protein
MTRPIHLELFTDFFNKIGPLRRYCGRQRMSTFDGKAEVADARSKRRF